MSAWKPTIAATLTLVLLGIFIAVSNHGLPADKQGGLVPAPTYATESREIIGGLMREPADHYCGDTTLPCAGLVEPGLRYRVAGDVASGFAVRGPDGALPPAFRPRWVIDREFLIGRPRP